MLTNLGGSIMPKIAATFDIDIIEQIELLAKGQGSDFLRDIFELFEGQTPDLIEGISTAAAEQSHGEILSVSHKLQGMAQNIGARNLAELASRLAQIGRSESDLGECAEIVSKLQTEFARARKFYAQRWA
jgi:HPt (histidine-containing phosphotransfer) domain-containing protein